MAIPDGIELMRRIEWITAQVHVSHVAHFGHRISSGIHPLSGAGKTHICGGVAAEIGIKGAAAIKVHRLRVAVSSKDYYPEEPGTLGRRCVISIRLGQSAGPSSGKPERPPGTLYPNRGTAE